eukprot:6179648-Pleurochrysis_carterae.AAC.1
MQPPDKHTFMTTLTTFLSTVPRASYPLEVTSQGLGDEDRWLFLGTKHMYRFASSLWPSCAEGTRTFEADEIDECNTAVMYLVGPGWTQAETAFWIGRDPSHLSAISLMSRRFRERPSGCRDFAADKPKPDRLYCVREVGKVEGSRSSYLVPETEGVDIAIAYIFVSQGTLQLATPRSLCCLKLSSAGVAGRRSAQECIANTCLRRFAGFNHDFQATKLCQ